MSTQPKSISHYTNYFSKRFGYNDWQILYQNNILQSVFIAFFFCLASNISGRIYVMNDDIYCVMNEDFVLTNNSTDRDQY